MYLTWGQSASHRLQKHHIHHSTWALGNARKSINYKIWLTAPLSWFIPQPVLDFLLWHHLGPNYEERAHDLLQVRSKAISWLIIHVACDRFTDNISPTLSMGWTLLPWSNNTYGGQRYRLPGDCPPSIWTIVSVEILVTVAVWVLVALTLPTLIVRPAVDWNSRGHTAMALKLLVVPSPAATLNIVTAWRLGWIWYASGTNNIMRSTSNFQII